MFNTFFMTKVSTTPKNQYALFVGGFTPPGSGGPPGYTGLFLNGYFTDVTEKYFYDTDIVSPSSHLGEFRENLHAAGNYAIGIIAGGDAPVVFGAPEDDPDYGSYNTAYVDKYTYATDVISPGTALGTGRNEHAASGTAFVGIFAGGATNNPSNPNLHPNIASSEKYTYAADTVAYGGNLQAARRWLSASSNPIEGIYAGGFINDGTQFVDLYTFSNDSVSAGTVLAQKWFARTGTGNFQYALIGGGYKAGNVIADIDKYTYTSATWTATTALTLARNQFGAASDPYKAVFGSGVKFGTTNGFNYTDVYKYSDETVVAGTVLGVPRYCIAGLSTSPSGL